MTVPLITSACSSEIASDCPASPVRLVAADGSLTDLGRAADIDPHLVRALHRDMARARCFDHAALALQRQGEVSLWLMSWGQEAAQVGSIRAVRDSDMVFPSYREHAAALCRGITPAELFTQWRGHRHAGWDPTARRFHIYSLVLGAQTLHATGYAAGVAMEGTDEIVVVYFGDGAASQGDVNEALNWAAATGLPILFFCQNNQWAISTPTATQMRAPVHRRAAGFGLRTYHVDGNDVLAVLAVTSEAAARVRAGDGPALIEAETYRLAGHSSSDDPGRYRTQAEVDLWQSRDPLARSDALLRALGTPDSWFDQLQDELAAFGDEVREACRGLTGPGLADLFGTVYAEPHDALDQERHDYLRHRDSLEAGR